MKTIGERLFDLVQRDQGNAFIADDMDDWDADSVIHRAEQALEIQQQLNKKLAQWIKTETKKGRTNGK